MADNMFTNLSQWRTQFLKENVQSMRDLKGGDFLSAETVVLIAGPAKYDPNAMATTVPIGLVQNVQVQQQKQIQQLFEIGSRKPFFIPGRTMISAGISRVLFDGPSLMYSLYMTSAEAGALGPLASSWRNIPGMTGPAELPADPANLLGPPEGNPDASRTPNGDLPDPGYFFINLASSFFNSPHGLGFVLYDADQQAYGGFYMEDCYIQTHNFTVASQQTVLVENVSLRASSILPLSIGAVAFS